jgi:hypothetical protein
MKTITILFLLIVLSGEAFNQQTNSVPKLTKQDYLQKSKNQKNTARIMLGGGVALCLTGALIPKGEPSNSNLAGYENDALKASFWLAGGLATLGSIHFFAASTRNKRKAMSLGFEMNNTPGWKGQSVVHHSSPCIRVTINLDRWD